MAPSEDDRATRGHGPWCDLAPWEDLCDDCRAQIEADDDARHLRLVEGLRERLDTPEFRELARKVSTPEHRAAIARADALTDAAWLAAGTAPDLPGPSVFDEHRTVPGEIQ